jgi:hypothetical protein
VSHNLGSVEKKELMISRKIDNVLGMATSYRQGNRGYECESRLRYRSIGLS